MTHRVDLIVRNGTVIDGTGGEPRQADIAVQDGRIATIGRFEGAGAEEIDARGPGGNAGLRRHPHPL